MRRRHPQGSSLTSMIDVVFILVFAALAQRASSESNATPAPAPAPAPAAPQAIDAGPSDSTPPAPRDFRTLREAGLVAAQRALERGDAVVLHVRNGAVTSVATDELTREVNVPLLEAVDDPDIALVYLGERSPGRRLCAVAAAHVDVSRRLVVVAVHGRLDDLQVALAVGLRRDLDHCRDRGALAVLIEAGEPR